VSLAVRLAIPAEPEYLLIARLAVAGLARIRPIDEEALADLKVALTEACAGFLDPPGRGPLRIVLELRDDRIAIEVGGPGPAVLPAGGLGLTLIEALSDALEVDPGGGGGALVRFSKLLAVSNGRPGVESTP
jgi:serine/threonine-protein kinase RsbW